MDTKTLTTNNAHCIVNESALCDKEVVQIGAGRSGSTVVWQVLQRLFSHAWKTHVPVFDFVKEDNFLCFFTYRDPRNILISRLRTQLNKPTLTEKDISKADIERTTHLINQKKIHQYLVNRKLLYFPIQYENFLGKDQKIGKLIREICCFCDLNVSDEDVSDILDSVTLKKNREIQSSFKNFNQADHQSGIHGLHISNSPTDWREILNEEQQALANKLLKEEISQLGYV